LLQLLDHAAAAFLFGATESFLLMGFGPAALDWSIRKKNAVNERTLDGKTQVLSRSSTYGWLVWQASAKE
jgi:hypothetical protein